MNESLRFVLYAPNVHMSGGLILLRALLDEMPKTIELVAFFDSRARAHLAPPTDSTCFWIKANIWSRLAAEIRLRSYATRQTKIFCFHGLPPILPSLAHVIVFQQNRNLFGLNSVFEFSLKTGLRIATERLISIFFRKNVSQYVVQTPSMERNLRNWFSSNSIDRVLPLIRVIPFIKFIYKPKQINNLERKWDFVYISHGEAHKNHRNLLQAWRILAQENLRPTLALTVFSHDLNLKKEIEYFRKSVANEVYDLGQLSREEVWELYCNSRALIFPSTSESFGLPLIEASYLGLPIIASELDYVRDVCVPVETFDPKSPVSIARAVKRFLGVPEPTVNLKSPTEFWQELLYK